MLLLHVFFPYTFFLLINIIRQLLALLYYFNVIARAHFISSCSCLLCFTLQTFCFLFGTFEIAFGARFGLNLLTPRFSLLVCWFLLVFFSLFDTDFFKRRVNALHYYHSWVLFDYYFFFFLIKTRTLTNTNTFENLLL